MDLNELDVSELIQPAGKAAQAQYSRELSPEDIQESVAEGVGSPADNPIARLRFRHHQLARMLVQGLSNVEAAAALGMHPQRISQLQNDPTFKELLQSYAERQEQIWVGVQEKMLMTGMKSLEALDDRLEEEPESLGTNELRGILQDTFDRAGFGPSQTVNSNQQHSASGDLIEALKQDVKQSAQGRVIDRDPAPAAEDAEFTTAGEEGDSSGVAASESQNHPGTGDSGTDDSPAEYSESAGEEDAAE